MKFFEKYGGFLLLTIGIFGILLYNIWIAKDDSATDLSGVAQSYSVTTSLPEVYYIDVKGAVNYPGLYAISPTMRIADVIALAGGASSQADLSSINLSKTLYDEMVLFIPFSSSTEVDDSSLTMVLVDLKGEVMNPGVYEVQKGTRLYQVIALAGGFTSYADSSKLNLSMEVVDQMMVLVERIEEQDTSIEAYIGGAVLRPGRYDIAEGSSLQDLITLAGGLTSNADMTNLFVQMTVYDGFELVIPMSEESVLYDSDPSKINLNTATLEELMELNGIGIILGQRIIDYRSEYGYFESIEDVMNVSGIKESIYEQIKDDITV